ncbi:MAG: peroxiredoxin family protein [Kaiparowitsia implicata GSE-PSE-MK54-09C]|jgi:peroxiredoxin|nr:peroxiredoxin family protein [Kaiparowitsia implicata GSE-PSE-MK54-09C]
MATSTPVATLTKVRSLLNRRTLNNAMPVPATNSFNMGSLAPPFELYNVATQQKLRLTDFVGNRVGHRSGSPSEQDSSTADPASPRCPVLLYFTRIFSDTVYCPLCYPHIVELGQRYADFVERGAEVLMIASTDPQQSQTVREDLSLPMPLLSDPTCRVFRMYQTGQALGAPLPAQFLVDTAGKIRFRHMFSFLEPNASIDRLLVALERIKPLNSSSDPVTRSPQQ